MNSIEEHALTQLKIDQRHRFYGKYRGIVKKVMDGNDLGKLIVNVPDVYDGKDSPPAWPCAPYAGPKHGLVALPEQGDPVWVEFEAGNPSSPIWTGGWWAKGDIPSDATVNVRTWATKAGLKIVLDDDNKELRLEHSSGGSISLTNDAVTLSFNSTTVTINDDGVSIDGTVQSSGA
jgi:hypothetical protein